jgi:hypothetical protein
VTERAMLLLRRVAGPVTRARTAHRGKRGFADSRRADAAGMLLRIALRRCQAFDPPARGA